MTSSLYSSSYDTFWSFRSTGLLAATPFLGSRKTWRTVTSSFFPHLEFLLNCCYIFQVLGFSLWQLLSFWIYPGSKVQISILRITQTYLRILLSSHEEQRLGEPECQLPLRDSHQWLTSLLSFPSSNHSSAQLSNIDLLSLCLFPNSVVSIWGLCFENSILLLFKRKPLLFFKN